MCVRPSIWTAFFALRLTRLHRRGHSRFSEAKCRRFVQAWHDLNARPDVVEALPQLGSKFFIAPFTILNTALVIYASRRSGLTLGCIISCDMIRTYKTLPGCYATAAKWLGYDPSNILVTTHNNDLHAAHAYGFPTAFVYRPDEWGDIPSPNCCPDTVADLVCTNFIDFTQQLGV